MIKVSDYVIQYLERLGVKHMFMLPGGGAMHLNDSLGRSKKIQYVVCLHEQACAIAAEAYARVTNKPGLLMVTTGPGGTNAITGVAAAYVESTPMVVVSGQVKLADQIRGQGIRQQGMQELDIVSIVEPITKYAAMVTDPQSVKYHLDQAIYQAVHGRKGPVWLDIPLDVQASMVDETSLEGWAPDGQEASGEMDLECQVLGIIETLNRSKRPVLLAGNGIRLADGLEVFGELVECLQVPVLTTWNGIDLIEDNHPLFFGRPGGLGQRYANFVQQNSDFFLSIGARMNLLQTGYNFDGFAREAVKVMVDIDANELKKINVRPQIAVCADAREFIGLLLKHRDKIKAKGRFEWLSYARRMKSKYPIVQKAHWEQDGYANTYALLDAITEQMGQDDIFVSGSSGTCIDVSMQVFRVKKGQRVFSTKGLASMGFGVPATIGACLAGGGRRTVCVNGDGGFQMNIQELETIRRLNLPIKIFVLNNQGYAQIHATQKNIFSGHYVACDRGSHLTMSPVSDVAAAYGLKTFKIQNNQELPQIVKETLAYDGPVICEVIVPIELSAFPKQVSYKRPDGQMESLPLEYMNPMLPEEELRENMLVPMYGEV
ncbi:MAG: thiamine pyrophosphate-binding protein [Lachnospiraceae bacterium]|jgi:acetolactate synthase-1/2/3 large subunit|nr:thiamine pyrophosphate-binding protein [Lachnospiraceae bacterium]